MFRTLLHIVLAATAGVLLSSTSLAAPAADDVIPKDAQHFVITSVAAKQGDSWRWTAADGTRHNRESMRMRGMSWEWRFEVAPTAAACRS